MRANASNRRVSKDTGLARETVARYREWAGLQGLLDGELLALPELQRLLDSTLPRLSVPQNTSSVEAYRGLVVQLRREGVEVKAVHARIKERGYGGSYSSVYRFVTTLERQGLEHAGHDAVVRVETEPGVEAQVDFGAAGLMLDANTRQARKAWVFVMTLSYSRHQYVEFVFDQKIGTWLALHGRAFAWFEGAPARVTTDNLKAAVVKAAWHDPVVNRSYAECAEHYGFLIAPCRPRTPEHKGKVESGIHFVCRNFLAGRAAMLGDGRTLELEQCNRQVLRWCLEEAGARCHGTTREAPLQRYMIGERDALKPLPAHDYDPGEFKQVKLHRDCHVVFDNAYYSAPFRLLGQPLMVRGGLSTVRIFDAGHVLVATHQRSTRPGTRCTNIAHLPPHKVPGLIQTRESCLEGAAAIGPNTRIVIERMLFDKTVDRLPTAGRLLRLKDRYSSERLEAACGRAYAFDETEYRTIKSILENGKEFDNWPKTRLEPDEIAALQAQPAPVFGRTVRDLFGHLMPMDATATEADMAEEGMIWQ
jgi:transposase